MQGKDLSKKKMRWNYFYDDKVSIFTKIAERYDWKIIGKADALSGGFMHKMYRIDTQQGTFALKLLNPFVMQEKPLWIDFAKAETDRTFIGAARCSDSSCIVFGWKKNAGGRRRTFLPYLTIFPEKPYRAMR